MREWIRRATKPVGFLAGAIGRETGRFRLTVSTEVSVFTLHRVSSELSGEMVVSPAQMRRWIAGIQANGQLIGGEEFRRLSARELETKAPRLALLTVDDAFFDAYTELFPILQEMRVPVVLFVPTAFVDDPSNAPVSYTADPVTHAPCSWAQLREMRDSGLVTIGAHSCRHHEVTSLSAAELRQDCEDASRAFADAGIGLPKLYAYPRGIFSENAARVLCEYYDFAFAGAPHHYLSRRFRNMAIPRIPLRGSDAGWPGDLKVRGWPCSEERLTEWAKSLRSRRVHP